MGQPFVSVIINNYNYAHFVSQAVESALAQRYPHKEVLVVDDGSTDRSREVLEPYAERGVRLIFKENGGQASAFNRGFQESRGDIVAFLDADDYWDSRLLEKLAANWHSSASMALWRLQVVDAEGNLRAEAVPPGALWQGDIRKRYALSGWYPHPPTSGLAFSRNALTQILPIDETLWQISADAPLYTIAPFLGEVVALDEALGYYRVHGANLWQASRLNPKRAVLFTQHCAWMGTAIRTYASRQGIPHHPRPDLRDPGIVLRRLFVTLLEMPHPPWNDTVPSLVLAGLHAALDPRQNFLDWRTRLRYMRTFLKTAFLPRPIALRFVIQRLFGVSDKTEMETIIREAREAVESLAPKEVIPCPTQ